ncbi:MAG: HlyD family efflux transporter periplasmic adaptor subunit [Thermoanaerobaculia bacterium]|nr:HlyD family efflux transporter periplasmic adaptor subunit [Thermoanaerobaculia bacterium]
MDVARPDLKRKKQRKRMIFGSLAVLAVIAITVAVSSLEPAAREVDRATVWTDTVKRGEMLRSVRGAGTLVPEEIRWIAAETQGRVERILIDPGATVEPESVILELSDPDTEQAAEDAQLALASAEANYIDLKVRLESQVLDQEANLARVKADYQSAVLDAKANQELFDHGLIPDIDLESAKLNAEQLTVRYEIEQKRIKKFAESVEAQLAVERNRVEQARTLATLRGARLKALQVRAGIQGVVQLVPVEEGERVAPGTNLARVADPTELRADVRIAETQAKDIQVGQQAKIDTRNGIIDGHVVRIDPSVQQGTVTVEVALDGALPRGARPDLSVDGTIELERLVDVLYVGRPVYGQPNSKVGMYKIGADGETAQLVQVHLGRSSTTTVEVIEGLLEGDEVILTDSSQWSDAERIRLR